ncbi:hypothetical protein BDP27DRAFT_962203 [Rhodocollybia butyracea]|uniref:RING-type domain-containing protein n=1 Tax=Rhodocollybia butyracea TaxID=206335 RepID=A0A9P5Q6U2_9AGAR|nr:hypothetical protein BDP27DRAFT_962203 [Rhodocollybia butyracea]
MSNNNITLNPFTGLFRSMSRRSSQRHNPNTETSTPQQRGDVDMDSQQQSPVTPAVTVSNTDATLSNLPADAGHDVGNESDSSMPVLEDVSDSSDSDGAVDYDDEDDDQAMDTSEAFDVTASSSFIPGFVGIQSDFHTHDDEGGDGDDDGVMPPLEPVRLARPQGTRRARVEDDVDGDSERDRRHPSQRASRHPTPVPSASAIRPPERQAGVPGVAADPLPSNPHRRHRHHHPYQPIAMNFLSQMGFGGTGHAANLQPSGNRPQSNPREGASQGNGQQPATPRNPITTILELLQAGGQTGTFTFNSETGGFPFFGMRQVPEREDSERAKVLVDGLEEVPPGLIRRLERISPESSGCAICWEKLLEDAAEYLRREEEEEKNKTTEDAIKADSEKQPDMSVNTTAGPAAVPSTSSTRARIPKYPRIVTLPCSHVFHADCLIPWFTRPHQTTCPTCRFNIDPDNLTHGIGARRRAAASASGGDVAAEVGGPVPDPTRIEDSANVAGGNGEFVQGFFGVVEGGPEGPTYAPVAPPHFTTMRAAAPARNSFFPFSRSATTVPRRTASAGESSTPSPSARASTNPSAPTSNSSSTPATNNSGIQGTNSSANGSSASTAPTAPVSREHLVWPSAPRAQPVLPQTIMNEQMQGLAQAFAPHPRPNPTQRPRSERAMNVATNNILSTSDSSDASTNNGSSATSANSNASSSSVNLGPQSTVQSTVPPPSGAHVHFQPQPRAHHRRHHPQPGNFVIGFDFVVTNSSPEEPENENEHDDNTTPLSTEWTLEQIPFDPPGWGMQPGDSFASAPFTLEEEQV